MAATLRLYDLSDSPFCAKVRICLNLKQVPYERVTLTLGRRHEVRQLNALGEVPVLITDTGAVADSSEIVRLLDKQFPKPPLIPKESSARAYCSLVEEWADESLAWIVGAFKSLNPRNRKRARASAAEMASGLIPRRLAGALALSASARRYRAWGYSAHTLSRLQAHMRDNLACLQQLLGDKPFLMGKYVTLADIAVYAQLACMRRYEEGKLLSEATGVQEWMARLDGVEEIRKGAGDQDTRRRRSAP